MTRITRTLAALALLVGGLFAVMPAAAADPGDPCDDACTIAALQEQVLTLTVENANLRSANDQLVTEKAIALGEVVNMRNQRDAALNEVAQAQADFNALVPKVSRFYARVVTLRILVKDLRQTIRSLT